MKKLLLLLIPLTAFGQGEVRRIDTIAQLRQLPTAAILTGNKATYNVAGYYAAGDGGGGEFYWDNTSTATTNRGTVFSSAVTSPGRWFRIEEPGPVDIRKWGGKAGDQTFDNGPVIRDFAVYHHNTGGGALLIPGIGEPFYLASTTLLPKNFVCVGVGSTYSEIASGNTNSSFYAAGSPSWLRRKDGFVGDLFNGDTNNAYANRNPVIGDGSSNQQFYANIRFQGLMVDGNVGNIAAGSDGDSDCFDFRDLWNIAFENVTFVNHAGYAIRARNLNALTVRDCYITEANFRGKSAVLVDDCADIDISNNLVFGGLGPRVSVIQLGGQKSSINFNKFGNSVGPRSVDISALASGLFTATNHNLWNGDPLLFSCTVTNDFGLNYTNMYYALRVSANTFRVHTNFVSATAGSYLTPGAIPGGATLSFSDGGPIGVLVAGNARRMEIIGNRVDQVASSGMRFLNARLLNVLGNTIQETGYETNYVTYAFEVDKYTEDCQVAFNAGTGFEYGMFVGDGSRGNRLAPNMFRPDLAHYSFGSVNAEQQNLVEDFRYSEFLRRYGSTNTSTALTLHGGLGGTDLLRLERNGVSTIGVRVTTGGFEFVDVTNNAKIFKVNNQDASTRVLQFGSANTLDPNLRNSWIQGDIAPTGYTNWQPSSMVIVSSYGTGTNKNNGDIIFRTPNPSTNETATQAASTKFWIRREGQISLIAMADPTNSPNNGDMHFSTNGFFYVREGGVNKRITGDTAVFVDAVSIANPNFTTPGGGIAVNYVNPEVQDGTNVQFAIDADSVELDRLQNQSSQRFLGVGDRGGVAEVEPLTLQNGSGISFAWPSANVLEISATSGGGGGTNGTTVTVDGGADLGRANFADTSTIDPSVSGTNVSMNVVADSIGLSQIAAAAESHFLDRANHTGTQTASTISDFSQESWVVLTNALVAGSNISFGYDTSSNKLTVTATIAGSSNSLSVNGTTIVSPNLTNLANATVWNVSGSNITVRLVDRDFGDWTISSGGTVATIDVGAVNSSKIQDSTIISNDIASATITPDKLVNSGVSAGTYGNPSVTVNAQGQVTAITAGSGPVIKYLTLSTNLVDAPEVSDGSWHGFFPATVRAGGSTNFTAGSIASGTMYHFKFAGHFESSTTDYIDNELRFVFGGLTFGYEFSELDSYDADAAAWTMDVYVTVVTAGASATVISHGVLDFHILDTDVSGSGPSGYSYRCPATISGTLNTTGANTVSLDFKGNASTPFDWISVTHAICTTY